MTYKDTLNLPKTEFSMKANLSSLEPKLIGRWEEIDIYKRLACQRKENKKYTLHDGPPYANGLIHIGHALNKILKDIILKYKSLCDYNCPYIAGWDCHGLPVEHQLFKELGLSKHDVDIEEFRRKARNYALKFVGKQAKDFKRLGIFSDWENPYLTLDPKYESKVIQLLAYLNNQGYIYRGRKPVNWCAKCETALAEAEVEYSDKESDSIYFLFKLINGKDILSQKEDVYFLVWTTTPWTLVSNVAVALHPNLDYCLAQYQDRKIILAKSLIRLLEEKIEVKLKVLKEYKGVDLENLTLKHPFFERDSKVVLGDFVSNQEGSGCVHIAPGHGQEDFSLTKKYNLEVLMPVNAKGVFESPQDFKGKDIAGANKLVLKKLENNNALVKHQKITHSYPHCWRCKEPIIFRATFQWFLNIDHSNLRQKLLDETENVTWVPKSGKERMRSMLVSRPDWCLSRQRLWGIPIPAIKCCSCGNVILNEEVLKKTADIFHKKGANSWFSLSLGEFLPQDLKCSCGGNNFEKEFDILDVWFESGASFLAVVKSNPQLHFPADLYLEGSDQHRGWFQVSLIPSTAKEGRAPYNTILTHGFVVDGDGRKMSKSLGNVIAPQEISKKYGSEILRLWAAYSDYSEDVKISEAIIKQLVDMYRKVRNTIRFILGNIADFDPEKDSLGYQDLVEVDKYMLSKAMVLVNETTQAYEEFSFYKVCQKIFNFCNLDLSSFYLDILKDRLYTFSQNSRQRRSSQFVLYKILRILLKLIAPILSFTAEEAYLACPNIKDKKDSIFLSSLGEEFKSEFFNQEVLKNWEKILDLRSKVLKEIEDKREKGIIGSSLEAEAKISLKGADYNFFTSYKDVLGEIFIVSSVIIKEGDFSVQVKKAQGDKCARCWNWSETVGVDSDHPDVCAKCLRALKEDK